MTAPHVALGDGSDAARPVGMQPKGPRAATTLPRWACLLFLIRGAVAFALVALEIRLLDALILRRLARSTAGRVS